MRRRMSRSMRTCRRPVAWAGSICMRRRLPVHRLIVRPRRETAGAFLYAGWSMSDRPKVIAFRDEDFDLLEAWLARRGKGILDIVELEGFLTAVAIGPVTLMPSRWLPRVLGGRNSGFRAEQEFNDFLRLVMGLYNHIIMWFQHDPEHFEPTFYERRVKGKRIFVGGGWEWGLQVGR